MEFLNYPEYKRYLILNLIYRFGPISRTRLMELTDYIPATVSNIVKELLEEQLIVEQGFAYAGQGRRRTLLEINNNYICAFGVSISQASILAIVSTIQGDILKRIEHPLEKEASSGAIVDIVLSLLSQLSEEFSDRKVLGIGICDPGIIDPINNQSISSVRFSDWQNIHLKAAVEERTHLPVRSAAAVVMILKVDPGG